MTLTVEQFIEERVDPEAKKSARLALAWLRRTPAAVDTVQEVYLEGAKGNADAFRDFAAVVWAEVNGDYGGVLEAWEVAPDDERLWVGMLALVVGAWGYLEMGQR